MAEAGDASTYSLIAVGLRGGDGARCILVGAGSGQDVFESAIGRCLREEEHDLSPDLCWMSGYLGRENALVFTMLQSGIPPSDLKFFQRYWAAQFAHLVVYPEGTKTPAVTSDSGRDVDHRLTAI